MYQLTIPNSYTVYIWLIIKTDCALFDRQNYSCANVQYNFLCVTNLNK